MKDGIKKRIGICLGKNDTRSAAAELRVASKAISQCSIEPDDELCVTHLIVNRFVKHGQQSIHSCQALTAQVDAVLIAPQHFLPLEIR